MGVQSVGVLKAASLVRNTHRLDGAVAGFG